jgi:hypothetical protein
VGPQSLAYLKIINRHELDLQSQLHQPIDSIPSGPKKSKAFIAREDGSTIRDRHRSAIVAAMRTTYFVP